MRDYTLVVYTDPELTKYNEYVHVSIHGIKNDCLYIHYINKSEPDIIPLHAFYRASVMEK